jgi:hypothetical protein
VPQAADYEFARIPTNMDRLARNLDDLRALVQGLTRKGVRVEFVKEGLVFTGEYSPMANPMLSVMGAFAEFERSLIRERQKEGIALANSAAPTKDGRRPSHRNGPPNSSSAPAAMPRKPYLPVTTESAGKPSTSTCATPSWGETPPLPALSIRRSRNGHSLTEGRSSAFENGRGVALKSRVQGTMSRKRTAAVSMASHNAECRTQKRSFLLTPGAALVRSSRFF